jgi:hypothetical protein
MTRFVCSFTAQLHCLRSARLIKSWLVHQNGSGDIDIDEVGNRREIGTAIYAQPCAVLSSATSQRTWASRCRTSNCSTSRKSSTRTRGEGRRCNGLSGVSCLNGGPCSMNVLNSGAISWSEFIAWWKLPF